MAYLGTKNRTTGKWARVDIFSPSVWNMQYYTAKYDLPVGMALAAYLNTTFYPSTRASWQTELRLRRKRGHADDIGLSYVPYSNHFLRRAYKKGGSGLSAVVQSLPPGQSTGPQAASRSAA